MLELLLVASASHMHLYIECIRKKNNLKNQLQQGSNVICFGTSKRLYRWRLQFVLFFSFQFLVLIESLKG